MCVPNDFITIPTIASANDLEDAQSFIIATEVVNLRCQIANNESEFGNVHDFEFVIKSSRTCSRGGKLIGLISDTSAIQTWTVSAMLSTFSSTV